eukprot:scaffold7886_cov176-Amphora_coffeaeformis.AAC.2
MLGGVGRCLGDVGRCLGDVGRCLGDVWAMFGRQRSGKQRGMFRRTAVGCGCRRPSGSPGSGPG